MNPTLKRILKWSFGLAATAMLTLDMPPHFLDLYGSHDLFCLPQFMKKFLLEDTLLKAEQERLAKERQEQNQTEQSARQEQKMDIFKALLKHSELIEENKKECDQNLHQFNNYKVGIEDIWEHCAFFSQDLGDTAQNNAFKSSLLNAYITDSVTKLSELIEAVHANREQASPRAVVLVDMIDYVRQIPDESFKVFLINSFVNVLFAYNKNVDVLLRIKRPIETFLGTFDRDLDWGSNVCLQQALLKKVIGISAGVPDERLTVLALYALSHTPLKVSSIDELKKTDTRQGKKNIVYKNFYSQNDFPDNEGAHAITVYTDAQGASFMMNNQFAVPPIGTDLETFSSMIKRFARSGRMDTAALFSKNFEAGFIYAKLEPNGNVTAFPNVVRRLSYVPENGDERDKIEFANNPSSGRGFVMVNLDAAQQLAESLFPSDRNSGALTFEGLLLKTNRRVQRDGPSDPDEPRLDVPKPYIWCGYKLEAPLVKLIQTAFLYRGASRPVSEPHAAPLGQGAREAYRFSLP